MDGIDRFLLINRNSPEEKERERESEEDT
jgi:hypothetical protein